MRRGLVLGRTAAITTSQPTVLIADRDSGHEGTRAAARIADSVANQRLRSIVLVARAMEACETAADQAGELSACRVHANWSRYQLRATRRRLSIATARRGSA